MSTPFAISQLAKKLRLEANVTPKLTRFFREISRSITPVLRITGRVPSLESFNDDLVEILTKHYKKVAKEFKGDTVATLTKSSNIAIEIKQETIEAIADETEDIVDEALASIIALRAPRQASFILRTTERELSESVQKVAVEAAKDGETLTLAEQGRRAARDFNSKISGRVETISMVETQAMAEETKLTEAQTISNTGVVIGGIVVAVAMRKTWNTILDEKTRSSHVIADLQERTMLEPFNVQGQFLKVPGDTSLGATLDNIINCRCAANFSIGS